MKSHKETVKAENLPQETLTFLEQIAEENRQIFNNALNQAKTSCDFKKFVVSRDLNAACNIAQRIKGLWLAHDFNKESLTQLDKRFVDSFSCLQTKLS